jgi:hypothetical protein
MLIIALVALGILVAYKLLTGSRERETPSQASKVESQVEEGEKPAGERSAGQKVIPRSSTKETQTTATGAVNQSTKAAAEEAEADQANPRVSRRTLPAATYGRAQQLLNILRQMKPRQGKYSPQEIEEINRLIQELKQQGQEGIMAIQEFLESGQDVSLAEFTGKTPPEYASLRLALIDALVQMGGSDVAPFMAGMLQNTMNLEEIALLAKGLEQSAPGAYRAEIMKVARTMLDQALQTTSGQYPGLGHLFGMIQEYGDASLAVDLENMYRESPSTFTELALMALSKLPEGNGVPTLLKIVNEMSGSPETYGMKYDMALRYLTQASREYPEAGEALLSLTAANKITTAGLIQVANALGGTEHQLITKSSDISLQSRAETKISLRAAETWSDAEIDQRLGLIDNLLRLNTQPTVAKALEDARNRLRIWKDRPMIDGKRVRQ